VSAAAQASIGARTAADTCSHGNAPWSVQIVDMNVSIFAHFQFADLKIIFLSKILRSQSECITVHRKKHTKLNNTKEHKKIKQLRSIQIFNATSTQYYYIYSYSTHSSIHSKNDEIYLQQSEVAMISDQQYLWH